MVKEENQNTGKHVIIVLTVARDFGCLTPYQNHIAQTFYEKVHTMSLLKLIPGSKYNINSFKANPIPMRKKALHTKPQLDILISTLQSNISSSSTTKCTAVIFHQNYTFMCGVNEQITDDRKEYKLSVKDLNMQLLQSY